MPAPKMSPHFFAREPDGSVRLRLRFSTEEADAIEEAAGSTPLIEWIHDALLDTARYDIEEARRSRPQVRPLE